MSIVRPFRGLRPIPERAQQVASPPYDVLSAKEAREMAQGNPLSFLRVNKAEIDFDEGVDPYGEEVYRRGKVNLQRLADERVMVRDEQPCFYLYRLTMNGQSQTGLMALTSVEEYNEGRIKKHEHTRPEKVKDRASHIQYLEAQVGPVFSAFRQNATIREIFARLTSKEAPTDFVADDGVRHELWVVEDPQGIQGIVDAFAQLPHIYIADGHHRSAAAAEVARRVRADGQKSAAETELFDNFLNVIFPDDELRILPYNRVVKDLNGLTLSQLLAKAAASFDIRPATDAVSPTCGHEFGLYCEGKWTVLTAKPGSFDSASPTGSIDASILGANFIGPLLGITDPKTDKRINFVGGIRGTGELVKLVDSGEYRLAFSLYPTSIQQLFQVADAGEVMPPKSTWFEPKLRSGMVVNLLTV